MSRSFLQIRQAHHRSVLAKAHGVPLVDVEDAARSGTIYAYHLELGVATPNEARAALGLPPRKGGDKPLEPGIRAGGLDLSARVALSAREDAQGYADDVADAARDAGAEVVRPDLEALLAAVESAKSLEALRDALPGLLGAMTPEALAQLAEGATLLSALAGRRAMRAER